MFLFKRLISVVMPIVGSQVFWFILVDKSWYYWWLGIWLVGGSLVACLVIGLSHRSQWLKVIGQYIALTIMPTLLLVLVSSPILQALLTIFLAFSAISYYYFIFEKFLLKNTPTWWPTSLQVILGFDLIIGLTVMYGLVEFLNFSIWLSGLFIALLVGFLKYFYDASFEPSWLAKVVAGTEGLLGFRSSTWLKQFQEAAKIGFFALELFLVVWLLPILFYLKALLVAAGLIFWVSLPRAKVNQVNRQYLVAYWTKWIITAIIIVIILLLSRWF